MHPLSPSVTRPLGWAKALGIDLGDLVLDDLPEHRTERRTRCNRQLVLRTILPEPALGHVQCDHSPRGEGVHEHGANFSLGLPEVKDLRGLSTRHASPRSHLHLLGDEVQEGLRSLHLKQRLGLPPNISQQTSPPCLTFSRPMPVPSPPFNFKMTGSKPGQHVSPLPERAEGKNLLDVGKDRQIKCRRNHALGDHAVVATDQGLVGLLEGLEPVVRSSS
eukprot:749750-Hanusia_phi.AAC.2